MGVTATQDSTSEWRELGAQVKGFDTPEKAAFAHIHPELRTRVLIHEFFMRRVGAREPVINQDFRDVMRHIEAVLAFADPEAD